MHARSCISRETPTGNYAHGETHEGEKEIAKAHGGSQAAYNRAPEGCAYTLYVEKTTTTICQLLRDGSGSYPRTPLLFSSLRFSSLLFSSLLVERRKSGGKRDRKREDTSPSPGQENGARTSYVDRGYKSSR